MTHDDRNTTPYQALKPVRIGPANLLPGDPVPVLEGRDYRSLVRKGLLRDVRAVGGELLPLPESLRFAANLAQEDAAAALLRPPTATAPQDADLAPGLRLFLPLNSDAYFVGEDGAAVPVTLRAVALASAPEAERLSIEIGSLVATVEFSPAEGDRETVPAARVLPFHPTEALIADLAGIQALDNAEGLVLGADAFAVTGGAIVPVSILDLNVPAEDASPELQSEEPGALCARLRTHDGREFWERQSNVLPVTVGSVILSLIAQAGQTPQGETATPEPEPFKPYEQFLIGEDGMPSRVWIVDGIGYFTPDTEHPDGYSGPLMIRVSDTPPQGEVWEGNPDAYPVPVVSLLPIEPTARLVAEFEALIESDGSGDGETDGGEVEPSEAEQERDYLADVLAAIRMKGDDIPEGFPSRATLITNGVRAIPGLVYLAEGEHGPARLSGLHSVSDKQAAKMISALVSGGYMKAAPAEPEPTPPQDAPGEAANTGGGGGDSQVTE